MREYTLTHLDDAILLRNLAAIVVQERGTLATLLAHIAEVDSRKLYVPTGYTSMFAYCVEELRLSEDAAYRRIQAARAARRFPALFVALAEGRLHLTAISQLAPHLTPENVDELIGAATCRKKAEIDEILAHRFRATRASSIVRPLLQQPQLGPDQVGFDASNQLVPDQVGFGESSEPSRLEAGTACAEELGPDQVGLGESNPIAPGRVVRERYVQVSVKERTHDKIRYAQALLSHTDPRADASEVLDRAMALLIAHLEKRKLGSPRSHKPGSGSAKRSNSASASSDRHGKQVPKRYIPTAVRRAVWDRDEGQCTFVGTSGHRCAARHFLEFDHVEPVARGGAATVAGIRLRCRAHNQYEAERIFGTEFMRRKREGVKLTSKAPLRAP